jgi:hypothetical protein
MLVDRACPRGGWNAGNSVVFGVELDPHPDFTAMAALALRHSSFHRSKTIERSLNYLVMRLTAANSPHSLAWAVTALSAYGHQGADRLRSRLKASLLLQIAALPVRTLALAAIGLEIPAFTYSEASR